MNTRVGLDALESAKEAAPILIALSGTLFSGGQTSPLPSMFQALLRRSLESPEAMISRAELFALSVAGSGLVASKSAKSAGREAQKRRTTENKNFTWRLRVLRESVGRIGPLPPDGLFFRWQFFRRGRNRSYRIDFAFQRGSRSEFKLASAISQSPIFRYRYVGNLDSSRDPLMLEANVIGHCQHKKDFSVMLQKLDVDWGGYLGIGDDQMRDYKSSRDQFWKSHAEPIRDAGRLAWNGRLWGLCRHSSTQAANGRILVINLSVTRIRQADVIYCRRKFQEEVDWAKKKNRISLGEWLTQRRLDAREAIPVLSPVCLGVLLITAEKHVVITQQGGTKNRAQQWSLTGRGALDSVYAPEEASMPDLSLLVQRKVAEEVGIPVSTGWIRHLGFVQLQEDGYTNNMILVAVSTNHAIKRVEEFIEERKFRAFISGYDIIPLKTAERELTNKNRFPGKIDESLLLALALNRISQGQAEVVV